MCHILFILGKSLGPVQTQGVRIMQRGEYQEGGITGSHVKRLFAVHILLQYKLITKNNEGKLRHHADLGVNPTSRISWKRLHNSLKCRISVSLLIKWGNSFLFPRIVSTVNLGKASNACKALLQALPQIKYSVL